MSRAFVKEEDYEQRETLPELPRSAHPSYISIAGLELLRERLAQLRARNDEADARELRRLEARVAGAIPVDPAQQPRDRVAFGATVTLALPDGSAARYRIVGEDEAAPERGWISWTSPLARALSGAQAADVVLWGRPAGDLEVEVTGIEYEK